jgi:hypothetical protein
MPCAARAEREAHAGGRLPSGWAELDGLLGGGWPVGELVELLGHGRSTLALGAVARAQAAGQPVAWVDGSGSFCPATCGVDLSCLTLVRPPAARPSAPRGRRARSSALLAADLLLRSRAFGLLVLDLPAERPPLASWFRLARQAARARTVLLLLGGTGAAGARAVAGSSAASAAGSAAGLTLRAAWRHAPAARWEPAPPPALAVTLARARGTHAGRTLALPLAPARAAATRGSFPGAPRDGQADAP